MGPVYTALTGKCCWGFTFTPTGFRCWGRRGDEGGGTTNAQQKAYTFQQLRNNQPTCTRSEPEVVFIPPILSAAQELRRWIHSEHLKSRSLKRRDNKANVSRPAGGDICVLQCLCLCQCLWLTDVPSLSSGLITVSSSSGWKLKSISWILNYCTVKTDIFWGWMDWPSNICSFLLTFLFVIDWPFVYFFFFFILFIFYWTCLNLGAHFHLIVSYFVFKGDV